MKPPFDQEDFAMDEVDLECKYSPSGDGQHPFFPRAEWRLAVANDDTLCGYWDWVFNMIQSYPED